MQQPQRCHFDSVFSAVESLLSRPGGGGIGQSDRSALAFGEEHSSITASPASSIPPRCRWWLEEQSPIKAVCNAFISRPNHGAQISDAVWRSGCCSLMSWQQAVMPAHLHHSALRKEVSRLSVSDPPVGILNSSVSLSNPQSFRQVWPSSVQTRSFSGYTEAVASLRKLPLMTQVVTYWL